MFPAIRPSSQQKQRPAGAATACGTSAVAPAVGAAGAPAVGAKRPQPPAASGAGAGAVAGAKDVLTEKYTLQEAELDVDDDDDPSKYVELPLESDDEEDEKTNEDIGFGVVGGDTDASNRREDDELHEYLKTLKFKANQKDGAKVVLDAELQGTAGPSSPAKRALQQTAGGAGAGGEASAGAEVVRRPTVVDDFIRNFFVKLNLRKSLEAFQTEWYELSAAGKLNPEDVGGSGAAGGVADIYSRNEQLDQTVKSLRLEVSRMTRVADEARATWDKFRRERDFHRMHHRRVVQEKNSLIRDMKRLKKTIFTFQPLLTEAKKKYEVAMKETMLYKLERDRLNGKVEALETQLKTYQTVGADIKSPLSAAGTDRKGLESQPKPAAAGAGAGGSPKPVSKRQIMSAGYSNAKSDRQAPSTKISAAKAMTKAKGDSVLPDDERPNPYADASFARAPADKFVLRKTFRGHKMAVSGVCVHPTKPVVATVSDDRTWKMWSVPNGDLILSGEGHKDWVSSAAFHPKGHALLATGSGDATVKLWDFMNAKCSATLSDHKHAVWSIAFHDTGDFLASASQDGTARLWDVNTNRARQTFRGHEKSVNSVVFAPFANVIATGSSDKTASVWDVRSALCTQTFKGGASVCRVAYNLQGNTLAVADYDGVVTLWDVRNLRARLTLGAKPAPAAAGAENAAHPAHDCTFDNSGDVLAVASYDGTIRVYNTADGAEVACLLGHEEAVQCVRFDRDSSYLISAASDATWRIWS